MLSQQSQFINTNSNVIAICGREGAGKSTIAEFICEPITIDYVYIIDPFKYIIDILFSDLQYWNLTYTQAVQLLIKLFRENIDSQFTLPAGPIKVPVITQTTSEQYQSYAFAMPLKQIACVIFDFGDQPNLFDILLGETSDNRVLREKIRTRDYDICGSLTGRQCLEYLGSNIFRDKFDVDIWVKLFISKIKPDVKYCITDMRYENEYKLIQYLNPCIIVVFRRPADLLLTETDYKQHPAKWSFLVFIKNIENIAYVYNNGSLADLRNAIYTLIGAKGESIPAPVNVLCSNI